MFTHGLYDRKWVYPSLLFLFLLFLFWALGLSRARGAEQTRPGIPFPNSARENADPSRHRSGHGEDDFIAAAERFNGRLHDASNGYDRFAGRDDNRRDLFSGFGVGDSVAGYYHERSDDARRTPGVDNDHRYQQARRQMDDRRLRETGAYRDQRRQLENRLSTSSRTSPDYTRLERELNDLDRRHAERERNYERDFRNMDADYSVARW
ncbi:MAG: hypothetical protein LUC93_10085 [Planctomycetaceae bacterium]|nr:hypothetical protein [Planctomycetaceae bacterium]